MLYRKTILCNKRTYLLRTCLLLLVLSERTYDEPLYNIFKGVFQRQWLLMIFFLHDAFPTILQIRTLHKTVWLFLPEFWFSLCFPVRTIGKLIWTVTNAKCQKWSHQYFIIFINPERVEMINRDQVSLY